MNHVVHLISSLPPISALIFFLCCIRKYLQVFYPHLLLMFFFASWIKNHSVKQILGSSSQGVVQSSNSMSTRIQWASNSRTRLSSNSISTILRHHAKYRPSRYENFASYLSDFTFNFFCFWNTFAVQSYPESTHLTEDQKSVCSLRNINISELLCHSLYGNSRPPTRDPNHYLFRLDSQTINHPTYKLRYHNLSVKRIDNGLQNSILTRNPELNK